MIHTAEVGLKRYFKCQDSIVFYLNVVDTNHAFLVHFGGKSVVVNRAMDCVFEKQSSQYNNGFSFNHFSILFLPRELTYKAKIDQPII